MIEYIPLRPDKIIDNKIINDPKNIKIRKFLLFDNLSKNGIIMIPKDCTVDKIEPPEVPVRPPILKSYSKDDLNSPVVV